MALTKEQELEYLLLLEQEAKQKKVKTAQNSFWGFCKLLAPDFYTDERWHLHLNCEILQALYERRLTGKTFRQLCNDFAPDWYTDTVDWERLQEEKVYTRLIQNLPPRHGKSRTLVLFCEWSLGKNRKNKIITCSYNDDLASDFSRYTRDGIMEQKNTPDQFIYSDIFPESKISKGNASFMQWALEGNFFSYKGAGIQGSITGKGGNITIVDDPIKNAEEAYNENTLDKQWQWYTGTFLSRLEDEGNGGIEIVNMTRWAKKDICGRILSGKESNEWLILMMEACYDESKMLCPSVLSEKRYNSLKSVADFAVFMANYHQKPLDIEGCLYSGFKTYITLPTDENGHTVTERIISRTDTADEGSDYLCNIIAHEYQGEAYVIDVYYTKDNMEVTEPETARRLYENKVNYCLIESNNGGKGFSRNVEKNLWEKHHSRHTVIDWFHQSENKMARILSNSSFAMNHIYFPVDWATKWPEFHRDIMAFQKEGKNKHDDAPDCLTGLCEMIDISHKVYLVSPSIIAKDEAEEYYEAY